VPALALLAVVAAWAQQRELKPGFNLFSKDQDIQLGKEAAAQIEQQLPVANNRELNEYVQRVGQKLASQPQADKYPYTFKVVQDKSINAFALPGGPTYVHTGLIAAADNEAQLAGVMAHEIAHVALRHGTNQASKANLIQLPAMLAAAIAGSGSIMSQLAQVGIGLGANSVLLKFSRNAERDADLLGARLMSQAGYNPIEMARFFEKLEAETGQRGAVAQFFSDHPNPGNRTKAVQDEIRYLPRQSYGADTGQFAQMKRLVASLPAPAARPKGQMGQSGGLSMERARPSAKLRNYRGREFGISYPENWETFGDNQSAAVTIASRDGMAQSANGAVSIGYGMMLSYYFPQGNSKVDLRRHTNELVRQLQSSNPGMQVGREGTRRMTIDGQAALVTTLYSQSPFQGEREMDILVTVARPQGLFYAVFILPEREHPQVRATFEEMIRSIRFSA
jgi:Zn-dependent protease with chaperone function